jgi:hypothetical protein
MLAFAMAPAAGLCRKPPKMVFIAQGKPVFPSRLALFGNKLRFYATIKRGIPMKLRHPLALPLLFLPMLGACAMGDAQQQQLAGVYAPSDSMRFMLGSNGLYEADFAMGLAGRGISFATWGTWRAMPDGRACFTPASLDTAHPQAYGRLNPKIPAGRIILDAGQKLQGFAQIMRGATYSTDPAAQRPGEDEDADGMKRGPFILALPQVLSPDGSKRQMRIYRFDPSPKFNDYWFSLSPLPEGRSAGMESMLLPVLFGEAPGKAAQAEPGSQETCGRIALAKVPAKAGAQARLDQHFVEAMDPPQIEHDGKNYERLALTPLPAAPLPPQEADIATGIKDPAKLHAFALSALLGDIEGLNANGAFAMVVGDNGQAIPVLRFIQDESEKTRSAARPEGPVFAHAPMGKDAPALRISATPMPDGTLKIALWTFGDPLVLDANQLAVERNAISQAKMHFDYFLKKRH